MALDRGTLGRIDRFVLSELDREDGARLAKVPLSKAAWSTWKRYCQALDLTLGVAIAGLIVHELGTLVNTSDHSEPVYAAQLRDRLVTRSKALDARERRIAEREQSLREAQRLIGARTRPLDATQRRRVGRNDPCPCGSGYKYKRCHGT